MKTAMDKQELVDRVIYQFQMDIENMDTTAIQELLWNLDDKLLTAYLPEENIDA
jgi:hypothetical protein